MNTYRELVASAIKATAIQSPTAYAWLGRQTPALPPEVSRAMDAATARQYLAYSLEMQLYTDFYCTAGAATTNDLGLRLQPSRTPFVESLSAANTGRGAREPGWLLQGLENGQVVLEREGLRVWARRESVLAPKEGLVQGSRLTVRFPKELLNLLPGFYMALGDEGLQTEGAEPLVRFYWNIRSEGAPALLRSATAALNGSRVPFRLKVVNDPDRYTRCDAGVLYVRRADYGRVIKHVAKTLADVAPALKPATPAFTKQLAPGLGLAEDPGDNGSFGTNRCRLLAEGIIRAYELGKRTLHDQLEVVEAAFSEADISLDTPYLQPGSADEYVFG